MGAIECYFLLKCAAHGLDHVTFNLVPNAVGIDDLPAVLHDDKTLNVNLAAGAVNFDVGHCAHIGARQLILHVRNAASSRDLAASRLRITSPLPPREAHQ